MIVGLGIDICDIKRIENTLTKYGDKFKRRCFTEKEISRCNKVKNCSACFAKRFASKEATAKALGTGINQGVNWKNIEIINFNSGKPKIILHGQANVKLKKLLPKNMKPKISITITDEKGLAQSLVIIEAI